LQKETGIGVLNEPLRFIRIALSHNAKAEGGRLHGVQQEGISRVVGLGVGLGTDANAIVREREGTK
jgi:hypothetical protein